MTSARPTPSEALGTWLPQWSDVSGKRRPADQPIPGIRKGRTAQASAVPVNFSTGFSSKLEARRRCWPSEKGTFVRAQQPEAGLGLSRRWIQEIQVMEPRICVLEGRGTISLNLAAQRGFFWRSM
eukprot:s235_g15.t1